MSDEFDGPLWLLIVLVLVVTAITLATFGVGIWAVVQLVQWVTSK